MNFAKLPLLAAAATLLFLFWAFPARHLKGSGAPKNEKGREREEIMALFFGKKNNLRIEIPTLTGQPAQ